MVILFGYFVVIVPFGNLIFQSNLLTKFVIPDFIVEFCPNEFLLGWVTGLWVISLVFSYSFHLHASINDSERKKGRGS